ncbi:protein trichome birefringence-like 19 [Impatiens glandulifera]|uniref:protein trichome birefringence-like 19 n=1 Tax=Impatiens glandulifera TaxID=253017 RepID=UPI001FB14D56|nr:protein trichome birefringence-like 19 [Impatiens glandulifera]
MVPRISEFFLGKNSAKEIWDSVKKRYGNTQNYAHIYQLKSEIQSLKKGSKSVTEIVGELTRRREELMIYLPHTNDENILQERDEQEGIYQLLASLDPSWDAIRAQILMTSTLPDFDDVVSRLQQEETRRSTMGGERMMIANFQKIVPLIALSSVFIIYYYYPFHNNMNYSSKTTAFNSDSQDVEEEETGIIPTAAAAKNREYTSCDISLGEWVPNPEGPYYTNTTCSRIQEHQNCMKYGRPDTGFLKWRWKPEGCELPIFDPVEFFKMMKGKKIAFVGDSIARNHMQSLICLLSRVEEAVDVSEITYLSQFKRFEFRKHKLTIAMLWSPYLVRTNQDDIDSKNSESLPLNLFLDEPDPKLTQQIPGFDYLIISAGQWFSRPAMFYNQSSVVGCLYCPQSNITHLTANFSYRYAFRTAFRAIVQQTNFTGTTFLRSFVPSHFENGSWNKGGDCVRQSPNRVEETRLDGYILEFYQIQLDELNRAQREGGGRHLKFRLIDVTRAMLMRPDGHPSKYGSWPTPNVTQINDCVHWCLPGPIDSWNDFLIQLFRRE